MRSGSGCGGSSSWPDHEEILVHGYSVGSVRGRKMRLDVSLDILPCRSVVDGQQIEHELGDGIGGGLVGSVHVRRIERGLDLVAGAVLGLKRLGGPAEFEPVAEEMMHHVHAAAFPMLEHHDGDAGRRHPGDEPFEVRKPLVGGNVIEGMRTEDEIALDGGLCSHDRCADHLCVRNRRLELLQEIGIRLDRDGAAERARECLGDFAVAGSRVDEHGPRG